MTSAGAPHSGTRARCGGPAVASSFSSHGLPVASRVGSPPGFINSLSCCKIGVFRSILLFNKTYGYF